MENQDEQIQGSSPVADTPTAEEVIPSIDEQKPIGPIVGIIIIVVLIAFAGLYFWGNKLFDREPANDTAPAEGIEDPVAGALESQSDSDDISSIEEDLDLTDLEDLDADLENIDAELSL